MLELEWEVDIFGDTDLMEGLDFLEQAFSNFREPLEASAQRAAASIGENIVRNLDEFAPLATSTLYATASFRKGGPLYRGGGLMEAASDTTGAAGSGYHVGELEATAGLDESTEIGKIGGFLSRGHAAGNDHPALPARSFVRVTDSDVEYSGDRFEDYVDKSLERAFKTRGGSW